VRLPNTQPQLFYLSAINEKPHFKVMWTKYKEIWEGLKFKGFSKKTETRLSGNFTTRSGAEGFVKSLRTIKGFTEKFEIIEVK